MSGSPMKLCCLFAAAILWVSSPEALARTTPVCPKPRGKMLTRSTFVQVFRGTRTPYPNYTALDTSTCSRQPLLAENNGDIAKHFVVAGPFVAWYHSYGYFSGYESRVAVMDVRVGDEFAYGSFNYPASAASLLPLVDLPDITDLVLGRDGDMAWIGRRPSSDATLDVSYAAFNPHYQQIATFDAAPDVIPGSLALGRHDVYWQRADGPRSAERVAFTPPVAPQPR